MFSFGKKKPEIKQTQETVNQAVNDGGVTIEKSAEDIKFEEAKKEFKEKFGAKISAWGKAGNGYDVKKLTKDYMENHNGELAIEDREIVWKVKKATDKIRTTTSSVS